MALEIRPLRGLIEVELPVAVDVQAGVVVRSFAPEGDPFVLGIVRQLQE